MFSKNIYLKNQTYGLSSKEVHYSDKSFFNKKDTNNFLKTLIPIVGLFYVLDVITNEGIKALTLYGSYKKRVKASAEAVANYRENRENGTDIDSPQRKFPQDGKYSWVKNDKDGYTYTRRYDEGPKDKKWMKEKDCNYLVREANALLQQNEYENAIELYEMALKIDPFYQLAKKNKQLAQEILIQQSQTNTDENQDYNIIPTRILPTFPRFKKNSTPFKYNKTILNKLKKIYDPNTKEKQIKSIIKYYNKLSNPLKKFIEGIARMKQQFSYLSGKIENEDLLCPIGFDIMEIPILLPDGKPGDLGNILYHFYINKKSNGKANCPETQSLFSPELIAPNLYVSKQYNLELEKLQKKQKNKSKPKLLKKIKANNKIDDKFEKKPSKFAQKSLNKKNRKDPWKTPKGLTDEEWFTFTHGFETRI
jgi:tetratricopeptide (TPR) repeat protein